MGKALDGQVAIVTGGARGQGRAFAVALAGSAHAWSSATSRRR